MWCDLNVSTSTSSSWAWCSISSSSGSNGFPGHAGDFQTQSSSSHWTSLNFILFSAFRVACLLPLASHCSNIPASSSVLHLPGDVMVLSIARSRPATTGYQRFISFLNTSAPCGRTSSCHDVLRFVARQSCQRQVPLTVVVLDSQQRCRRDLSWTSESRFCCVLNHPRGTRHRRCQRRSFNDCSSHEFSPGRWQVSPATAGRSLRSATIPAVFFSFPSKQRWIFVHCKCVFVRPVKRQTASY